MSARVQVYSTMSTDTRYTLWKRAEPGSAPEPIREVLIKGGANVATKLLVTPRGIRTEISEEDYEQLKLDETFKRHLDGGFIQIRKDIVDPEVAVAAGMKQKDSSAPLTPESEEFGSKGVAKPAASSTKDAPIEKL